MVHLFDMFRIPMRYLGNFCQITAAIAATNINMKAISFLLTWYRVYKKTEPFKFKLSASCCINKTALNASDHQISKNTRSCTHWKLMIMIIFKSATNLLLQPHN